MIAAVVVAAVSATVAIVGLAADRLDGVQAQWEDLLQPGLDTAGDVVVVAIDRETLQATGEAWPWPRALHASLLRALAALDPTVVVYDVLFNTSRSGDGELADAVASTTTVLASALTLQMTDGGPPRVLDRVDPIPALASAAADVGHVNVTSSAVGGMVRFVPLYALDERDLAHASVVLSAVAAHEGKPGPLIERPGGVQIGDRFIPAPGGRLRINWTSDEDLRVVSARDVIDGTVEPTAIAGKIVLVGVTEPTLGDLHLVPVDRSRSTSGVEVLAHATNTIVTAGYLREAGTADQVIVVAVLAIVVAMAYLLVRLALASALSVAVIAAAVLWSAWRFHSEGELWNVVWPTVAVVCSAVLGAAWRYVTEIRHQRRAWALFSTYVPASVVAQLADARRLRQLGEGERLEVAVLFCDLRGFTPLAGRLAPGDVRRVLDHYYEFVVERVHRAGGTVMQFVGDEVFAVFGTPVPKADASEAALRCAIALQDEAVALDSAVVADGLPTIGFGVAVHRGEVVAAHVGARSRRQYSVVGDTVNVGSRLCESAAADEVVVSEAALAGCPPDIVAMFSATTGARLKGISGQVNVARVTARTIAQSPR